MSEKIEIVSSIVSMENKLVTVLEYDGNVYELKSKKQVEAPKLPRELVIIPAKQTKLEQFPETKYQETLPEKGTILETFGNIKVWSNIFDDFKAKYEETKEVKSKSYFDVFRNYYPNHSKQSFETYAWAYFKKLGVARRIDSTPSLLIEHRVNLTNSPVSSCATKFGKEKGDVIVKSKNSIIYSNILKEVKEGLSNGFSGKGLCDILAKFYPNMKPTSIRVTKNCYIRYINGKPTRPRNIENKPKTKTYKKRSVRGKIHIKQYHTHVSKNDVAKVVKSIHRWNFEATSESIQKETGLKLQLVRAILHYLVKKHKAYIARVGKCWVYHPIPTTKEERKSI